MSADPPFFANCEFQHLTLSDIKGIDPEFQEVFEEIGLNLPAGIRITDWPQQVFEAFLVSHPICIRKRKDGFKCIGGFRQLKIAQSLPSYEEMLLPVIVFQSRLTAASKMSLLASEIYMFPSISRLRKGDASKLVSALPKLIAKFPELKEFDVGKAMGLDPRTYGQVTKKQK